MSLSDVFLRFATVECNCENTATSLVDHMLHPYDLMDLPMTLPLKTQFRVLMSVLACCDGQRVMRRLADYVVKLLTDFADVARDAGSPLLPLLEQRKLPQLVDCVRKLELNTHDPVLLAELDQLSTLIVPEFYPSLVHCYQNQPPESTRKAMSAHGCVLVHDLVLCLLATEVVHMVLLDKTDYTCLFI